MTIGNSIYTAWNIVEQTWQEIESLNDLITQQFADHINDYSPLKLTENATDSYAYQESNTGLSDSDLLQNFFISSGRKRNTELSIQIQYSLSGLGMSSSLIKNEEPLIIVFIEDGEAETDFGDLDYENDDINLLNENKLIHHPEDNEYGEYYYYVLKLTSIQNENDSFAKIVIPALSIARDMHNKAHIDELTLQNIGAGLATFVTNTDETSDHELMLKFD